MVSPETTPPRRDFVIELIAPRDAYRPFGGDDSLSEYLYRQVLEDQTADVMIAFVDDVETLIDTEEPDSQLNQEKILRLIALVADIPREVPETERLKVWRHLFEADWVHMCSQMGDIERVMSGVERAQPEFAPLILGEARAVLTSKSEQFGRSVSFSDEIPKVLASGFDSHAALDAYARIHQEHPELIPVYNSMLSLSAILKAE